MQKNSWSTILSLTVVYSFLFYHENAGVNFLLFTISVGIGFIYLDRQLIRKRNWLSFFIASVLSSFFIVVHPTSLAILAWSISMLLSIANTRQNSSSLLLNLAHGAFSIGSALPLMFIRRIHPELMGEPVSKLPRRESFVVYFILGASIVTFLVIYKSINPLFEKYTEVINLNFITINWLFFTLGGLILVYGLMQGTRIPKIDALEINWEKKPEYSNDKALNPLYLRAFVILFSILNLLLVLINLLDIQYLYLGYGMPPGITHKQFVHNGVGLLNFSIFLGVVLILFAFSSKLNFSSNNKTLKLLVYLWLAQNLFMIVSTGIRNQMYIQDALLTYKRILVFYWLGLTASLLISTWIRVRNNHASWKLIRSNSMVVYLLLLFSSWLDWDLLISEYNYSRIKDVAGLDKKYLITLSEGNIPLLYTLKNHPKFEIDSSYHYGSGYYGSNKSGLDLKLYNFLTEHGPKTWKSFNLRASQTLKRVYRLDEKEMIDTLNLSGVNPVDFSNLTCLKHLKVICLYTLNSLSKKDIECIENFPKLETLLINYASAGDSMKLREFKQLKKLVVRRFYSRSDSIYISKMKLPYRLEVSQKSNKAL